jgi:F0F1-type ATP synthase assembly protein I
MIGKFLEDEENNSAVKAGSNEPQTEESNSADVFSLPNPETEDQTENNISNETDSERQAAVNLEDYTVAPPDAIVPANIPTEIKTESLPPETTAENLRKTGLAWTAATVLGGSVVFMLIIGWFFDLVFGSKPWGVVGGIVLGAIVGFIQFFRITSQIFKNEGNTSTGILGDKD